MGTFRAHEQLGVMIFVQCEIGFSLYFDDFRGCSSDVSSAMILSHVLTIFLCVLPPAQNLQTFRPCTTSDSYRSSVGLLIVRGRLEFQE